MSPKRPALLDSFQHAWRGLVHTVRDQRNMRVHVIAGTLVGFVGSGIPLGLAEKVTLIFCVILVFFAEILNSALEALVDLATEQLHENARITKDAAAAGVLVLAIGTVVVFAALMVHNWPVVTTERERIVRQLLLGLPVSACVTFLVWPHRPLLLLDASAFALATALLAIQLADTASTVFTALTFGLVILAYVTARSRPVRTPPRPDHHRHAAEQAPPRGQGAQGRPRPPRS